MVLNLIKWVGISLLILVILMVLSGNIAGAVDVTQTVFGGLWIGVQRIGAFITALFS